MDLIYVDENSLGDMILQLHVGDSLRGYEVQETTPEDRNALITIMGPTGETVTHLLDSTSPGDTFVSGTITAISAISHPYRREFGTPTDAELTPAPIAKGMAPGSGPNGRTVVGFLIELQ
jgi:hypothetical protein